MFFKDQLKKRIKNEKGLTLIELLAVIVILAIIAAIAIPAIGNIIQNTRIKGAKSDALNILSAANIYSTDISGDVNITVPATKSSATDDAKDFLNYVESLGVFEKVEFSINETNGKLTISATEIPVGNKKITFANASVTDIDSSTPDSNGEVVKIEEE